MQLKMKGAERTECSEQLADLKRQSEECFKVDRIPHNDNTRGVSSSDLRHRRVRRRWNRLLVKFRDNWNDTHHN